MQVAARRGAAIALALALAMGLGHAARATEAKTASSAETHVDSPRSRARASFARAEQAERELRFAEALSAYREALTTDPSAPFAQVARARVSYLSARSEGGFAPLAQLEAVRRNPSKLDDRATIEALEQALATFPRGPVRAEAALVVAEAWWHRLGEPRRAIAPLERAIADEGADRLTRSLALSELVAVHRELDELDEARAVVERFPDLAPGTRDEVRRLYRRAQLRGWAIAALSILAVIGLGSLARAARRLGGLRKVQRAVVRPLAVAFSLYLGGAAAILVRLHGDGDPRPFLWLGLGVLAVDVIARTWRLGSGNRRHAARAARALVCAAGVLAVAFLAVERTNAGYLENFGL